MRVESKIRTYDRSNSVVFLKTKEAFGGLSNMAGGYPLKVNGIQIRTSEALYQACRFPHLPELQRVILGEASPMTAKMKGKPHRENSRPDWDLVRVKIMRWCLRAKLAQNWKKFSELLLLTGNGAIVEESRKDDYWGAKPIDDQTLIGMNVLGRLLMELREEVRSRAPDALCRVEPLAIPDFFLDSRPIQAVVAEVRRFTPTSKGHEPIVIVDSAQPSLFKEAELREAPAEYRAHKHERSATTNSLQSYPKYKNCGVPWLGAVPAHWQVFPNRAIFTEIKDRGHPNADMLSVTIKKGVIRQATLLNDSAKKDSSNQDKLAYKLVRPGDIAYNKMRAWQGALGVSAYHGIVSPAYVVQRPRQDAEPRYLHYLLRTPAFAKEAERWSYGITSDMWSLRPEHFKMIYSCVPPRPEQAAIVRFLDHADRRIRRAIGAKQKLIKLLEEQKQAIIHRAVTRGLDPDVRLKPSSIEWLSDVPAHWDEHRLKYLAKGIQMGPFGASLTELQAHETGYKLYGQENTISGDFGKGNRWLERAQYDALRRYELLSGDLVLTRKGSVGKCKIVPVDACPGIADSDTIRVRLNRRLVAERFVVLLLHDAAYIKRQIEGGQRGAVVAGLNTATIGDLRLIVPPLLEQHALLKAIDAKTAVVSDASANASHELNALREYRTRLIADVVTGKLDVREAAARLPDEVDQSEWLEDVADESSDADEELGDADLDTVDEAIEA